MRFKYLLLTVFTFLVFNCKQPKAYLSKIEGKQIQIADTLISDAQIEAFIKPFREHIEKDLDSVLAYSMNTFSKSDGEFNTAIGNFMADVVFAESNPVFKSRTGKNIDMVILNHGGIRSIISKGNITTRTAFEIMPFENSIVVVAIKGSQINSLAHYLGKEKKAHPISKLKLVINKNFEVVDVSIKGERIDPDRIYYVATNDYLYNGGDDMNFFKPNEGLYPLDYKIRNALIDNFKEVDTINPVRDDRFIQIK